MRRVRIDDRDGPVVHAVQGVHRESMVLDAGAAVSHANLPSGKSRRNSVVRGLAYQFQNLGWSNLVDRARGSGLPLNCTDSIVYPVCTPSVGSNPRQSPLGLPVCTPPSCEIMYAAAQQGDSHASPSTDTPTAPTLPHTGRPTVGGGAGIRRTLAPAAVTGPAGPADLCPLPAGVGGSR